ncbi:MAG: acetyl-CoA carboxylase carboxyltransferase subunit alpha [Myxococcales bacterium]|nr:MAG: acetyl-CoA carboxylase carboxyltransferase subunit alpha [Myxococcales bacterium]
MLAVAFLDFEKPLYELEERIHKLKKVAASHADVGADLEKLEQKAQKLQKRIYADLNVWQKVQLSRHPDRPYFRDYLDRIFTDFQELHGDRRFSDDPAIIAGFGRFNDQHVAIIGQQKGRSTKQKVYRNFGMAHPEGYRKACRIMELANRFSRPIFTFIDTPGAYPGIGAEERGQSEAIGHSLIVMASLEVPIIATVIGEGGSGGALALGVANRILMLEFATYSVITPEGCASILWRDGARAPDAAEQLKLRAPEVQGLGLVDEVITEPAGGAHRDLRATATSLKHSLAQHLSELKKLDANALREQRYQKFRAMGQFENKA